MQVAETGTYNTLHIILYVCTGASLVKSVLSIDIWRNLKAAPTILPAYRHQKKQKGLFRPN